MSAAIIPIGRGAMGRRGPALVWIERDGVEAIVCSTNGDRVRSTELYATLGLPERLPAHDPAPHDMAAAIYGARIRETINGRAAPWSPMAWLIDMPVVTVIDILRRPDAYASGP